VKKNSLPQGALWVCVHPISKEKAEQLLATGVVSHREELIQNCNTLNYTCIGESISMTEG
jgi:hypothetical protein